MAVKEKDAKNQGTDHISLPSDANASGRTFGAEEIELLRQVIESGTLNCTKGTFVSRFEAEFARRYGVEHCCTTTSGTASLHVAVAAVDPNPGDEIISSPITDMGAIAPILYQTALPIFADVDPDTYNVTAETIAPRITRRTKAIIVTHLFGNPCDMEPIMALARKHNIVVIEDCAQAFLSTYKGKLLGTIGDIGCFSLQQTKHMTTGEGGMVITSHPDYARRMRLFHDKAWGYGDPKPDHYFLALNYRMTELQGAVALAQLQKLDGVVHQRQKMAELLTDRLRGVTGIRTPKITPGGTHVYWKYCLQVDETTLGANVNDFAARLKEYGIFSAPRYIQKPAFQCEILRDKRTFGTSHFPYDCQERAGEPEVVYDINEYPGTVKALSHILVLPWNELYTEQHVRFIADRVIESARHFLSEKQKGGKRK
jgi:dTDP-4-amino-4,6-dideoxygalactose transaminase